MISKPTLIRTILGFAFSTGVAFAAVNAAENGIILHDSIHDYADNAPGSYGDSPTRFGDYEVKIILDESYHDYVGSAVTSFETSEGADERAEFSAFEGSSFNVPWELTGVD